MFPISDINPTRRLPILTYILIGINIVVFLWEMTLNERELTQAFMTLSVVPRNVTNDPFSLETFLDFMRSMFFHGGIEHIAGNMLYLWLFGDNIEDRLGGILYLALYFISGFVAGIAQIMIDPMSPIPLIGASGAIAGVLGAYFVMYPGVRVRAIIPLGYIMQIRELPAWIVLGFWFVLQLISGFGSLGAEAQSGGGVAFFAHIGGFVAGMVLVVVFMRLVPQPDAPARNQMLYDRAGRHRL